MDGAKDGARFLRGRPTGKPPGLRIVDVDIHVNDPPEALAPYCELPWRKTLELLAGTRHGYVDIPGYAVGGMAVSPPLPGGHAKLSVPTKEAMREELDLLGVDDGILLPDNLLAFAPLSNIDYATAVSHAYNRWIAAEWLEKGNGLWGAILACPQNPEDSAEEIRRNAKIDGMKAVFLPTAGVDPLWGHRKYTPILQAAADCDLPVILHSVGHVGAAFPHNQQQFENLFGRQSINHAICMMANLASLMHTGVPAKIPNLKIAFTEAGISWVPAMRWRLDRYYDEMRREVPFLKERPSEYMRRQMFFGTQPFEEPTDPSHYVQTIEHYYGFDNTIFCSDWPHHDFDHPSAIFNLPMTQEQKAKIMGLNAVKMFNLPELVRTVA